MKEFKQLSLSEADQGEELRDKGVKLSVSNAEYQHVDWQDKAIQALQNYPHDKFQAEDVRIWAYQNGLPKPKNDRAWGAIMMVARSKGLIRCVGYELVRNPKAHRTPAAVWERV